MSPENWTSEGVNFGMSDRPPIIPNTGPSASSSRMGPSPFLPRKITIKTQDGRELDLSNWKKEAPRPPPVSTRPPLLTRSSVVVRMETIEAKEERLVKKREKKDREKMLVEGGKRMTKGERRRARKEMEKAMEETRKAEEETRKAVEEMRKAEEERGKAEDEQNIEREVKALLDKLAMGEFDPISDQIIGWANKSEAEGDCRTLIHVARLVFEKAIDGAARSEVYARLCKKMMETISPNIRDDSIRGVDGKPITGGGIFRRYLLGRCQESFEHGWAAKDAAVEASEDALTSEATEESGKVELYAAQEAR